jgi:hypothetical protein
METDNNKKNSEEKKRVTPFIWWGGGAALVGGMVVLATLLVNKNGQVTNLEKEITEKETIFHSEKDSLLNELWLARKNQDTLRVWYDDLNAELAETRESNNRLAAANTLKTRYITKYKRENAVLQESVDNYQEENEQLNTRIGSLNDQVENLQARSPGKEETMSKEEEVKEVINEQEEKSISESAFIAEDNGMNGDEDVSGYVNITDLGGAFGLNIISEPYSKYFYGISTINGYVINKRFLTGIGVGLNAYNGGIIAPLYLDFRYNFRESGYIPYISADGGFLFVFDNFETPGLFINPGVGVYKNISKKFAVNLGTGLYIQRTPVKASFINFRLGLIFFGRKED